MNGPFVKSDTAQVKANFSPVAHLFRPCFCKRSYYLVFLYCIHGQALAQRTYQSAKACQPKL